MLKLIKEYIAGNNSSELKKSFYAALNKYIDFRVSAMIKDHNRFKMTPIKMLEMAPKPPDDSNVEEFVEKYKEWYAKKDLL